jgi:hypothetical protein
MFKRKKEPPSEPAKRNKDYHKYTLERWTGKYLEEKTRRFTFKLPKSPVGVHRVARSMATRLRHPLAHRHKPARLSSPAQPQRVIRDILVTRKGEK